MLSNSSHVEVFNQDCPPNCKRLVIPFSDIPNPSPNLYALCDDNLVVEFKYNSNAKQYDISQRTTINTHRIEHLSVYKSNILFLSGRKDNQEVVVFLQSKTSEAVKFCQLMQKLYGITGFVPRTILNKSVQHMASEETAIFGCRKVSLPVAVNTMDECVKTLCAWRDTRKKLTGLSTKGPNGFIANKTICCLETNMLTMKEVLVMVERHSQYLQNGHALKVYTLLNESQIEHGFGCSYQSQTNEHSQHNEFLFAKRRIEMERILKTCKTPFYFKGKKKTQYADSIDADDGSQVPAQIMIDLVRKLQPRKTVRPSTGKQLSNLNRRP